MFIIFKAIYFALCFAMAFLGLIIAIHFNAILGLSLFALFIVKSNHLQTICVGPPGSLGLGMHIIFGWIQLGVEKTDFPQKCFLIILETS